MSVIPFQLRPGIENYATDWIYDPQLWDIESSDHCLSPGLLTRQIESLRSGRRTIVFIGASSVTKGAAFLAQTFLQSKGLFNQFLPVFAGTIWPDCEHLIKEVRGRGGLVIDRYLSDSEILELYESADFVWCCYHPGYDQLSGILGRSVQRHVVPILRESSLLQRFCEGEGLPFEKLDFDDVSCAIDTFSTISLHGERFPEDTDHKVNFWRNEALRKLKLALKLV